MFSGCGSSVIGTAQSHDQPDSAPVIESDAAVVTDAESVDITEIAIEAAVVPTLPSGRPIVRMIFPERPAQLIVGDNEIANVHISTSGGPITIKHFEVGIGVHPYNEVEGRASWNWASRWRWSAEDVRVLRNGVRLDRDVVRVVGWSFPHTPFTHAVHVVFRREEEIRAPGVRYTVILPVSGELTTGDRIGVAVNTWRAGTVRGRLTPDVVSFGPYGWIGPHIYAGEEACRFESNPAPGVAPAQFVWSDRSSPNHSDADCVSGGSDDWFTGTDVQMGGGLDFVH